MAGRFWETVKTKALIDLWAEDSIQSELEGAKRNRAVYQMLASGMEELGYHRMWSQCRVKIKNLVAKYRKSRDGNNITGKGRQEFVFYNVLDSILGTRPASQPDTIISSDCSGSSQRNEDEDETDDDLTYISEPEQDLEEGEHGMVLNNTSCTDTAEEYRSKREDLSEDSFTVSVDGSSSTTDKERTTTSHKKHRSLYHFNAAFKINTIFVCVGTDRKRSRVQGRVMEMMKEITKQGEEAEKRFFEFEEKRMKLEAKLEEQRRKREDDHELRMQEMFMKSLQQMMCTIVPSFQPPYAPSYSGPL